MKKISSKIVLIIVTSIIFYSCSLTKRVPEDKYLLTSNEIIKNNKKENSDELSKLMYQKPNGKVLGLRARLLLFNLAKVNGDSTYQAWLKRHPDTERTLSAVLSKKQTYRLGSSFLVSGSSEMLKSLGEAPVILDTEKTKKSALRLKNHFFNQGYFNTKVAYSIDSTLHKKAIVKYDIQTGTPFFVDSLTYKIESADLLPLYEKSLEFSLIKKGHQYNAAILDQERDRITGYFRNNGAYDFQKNYINYEVDTLVTPYKADITTIIDNKTIKQGDTLTEEPFKLYTIHKVDFHITTNPGALSKKTDSITTNGITIYSDGPLRYNPKTIVSANFIEPNTKFSDFRRTLTSRSFGNLKVFNYPSIEYVKNPLDSTGTSLDAHVLLIPKKKYVFTPSIDVTHSNIQQIGTEATLGMTFRNVFKGAELLDVSVRGNIGSSASKYRSDQNNFFDILEYGADVKLSFPRFVFFTKTDRILPRRMFPTTSLSLGFASQRNIGLDKQNLTSIFNYSWTPKRRNSFSLDLMNLQYVRNLNPGNYFNVYKSSYNKLNEIAESTNTNPAYLDGNGNLTIADGGADAFIHDVLTGQTNLTSQSTDYQSVRSISERKNRLSENNLILASNIVFTRSTRFNLNDNDFYTLRTKVESAGTLMNLLAKSQNNNIREDGTRTLFDVAYSQYIKTEIDFVKYFDLGKQQVLAFRAFGGIAIPYGNSNNIPFTRSYFAGGSNDNRAWQSYRLGPGRSGGINDFNEANMKLAFSGEYRFNVSGPWNLALFVDAGNIWNALDNIEDEEMTFQGFKSLKDIAVGSGLGVRYDFNFFLIRLDVGFKTYNPGKPDNERWFRELNLSKAVFNVGINYPF